MSKLSKVRSNEVIHTFSEAMNASGCENCFDMVYCLCAEKKSYSGMQNFLKSYELDADYRTEIETLRETQ